MCVFVERSARWGAFELRRRRSEWTCPFPQFSTSKLKVTWTGRKEHPTTGTGMLELMCLCLHYDGQFVQRWSLAKSIALQSCNFPRRKRKRKMTGYVRMKVLIMLVSSCYADSCRSTRENGLGQIRTVGDTCICTYVFYEALILRTW